MQPTTGHVVQFRVRVGHNTVTVPALNRGQAIAQARKLLASELPRLWDVITNLANDRFQVEVVTK